MNPHVLNSLKFKGLNRGFSLKDAHVPTTIGLKKRSLSNAPLVDSGQVSRAEL
jgi:hypothetical protein